MSLETSMVAMKDSQIALNTAIKTIANKTKGIIDSKGQANGVASLDATGKVPSGQLPAMNYVPTSQKGQANGVASLDASGKVPASQLPSYVDDVIEVAALPATGETGKIYIKTDDNKVWRWTGSAYVEISTGTGTADSAVKLATARTITLGGDITGSASFDGSDNVTITATIADDSHNHVIANIDGLQTALDGKVDSSALETHFSALASNNNATAAYINGALS